MLIAESVLQRLWHPYYGTRALLSLPIPILLLTSLPEAALATTERGGAAFRLHAGYSVPLAMPVLLLSRPQTSLESRVVLLTQYFLLYNFGSLLCMSKWTEAGIYTLLWLAASITFPRPRYLGESKVTLMTEEEFSLNVLFQPDLPSPSDLLAREHSATVGKIVSEAQITAQERKKAAKGQRTVVFPWDPTVSKCWDVDVLVARVAHRSVSPDVSFRWIPPTLSLSDFDFRSIEDLPLLVMFEDGKVTKRLPPTFEDANGEEQLQKGWYWSEKAIIEGLRLNVV